MLSCSKTFEQPAETPRQKLLNRLASQGCYLSTFKDADTFRNRIASARQEAEASRNKGTSETVAGVSEKHTSAVATQYGFPAGQLDQVLKDGSKPYQQEFGGIFENSRSTPNDYGDGQPDDTALNALQTHGHRYL